MFDTTYRHADKVTTNQQGHTLWVGDFGAAEDISWLKQHNILTGTCSLTQ